jgi:hypothetical protein
MLNRLKEQFIFETRLTIHIVRRDRLRGMSVIPLVSGILAFSGNYEGAIIVAIMVCVSETAAYLGPVRGNGSTGHPVRRRAARWSGPTRF